MPGQPPSPPSFTPFRRWQIGFDLAVRTVLVLAVAVMVNYLSAEFYTRFYLSNQTSVKLSSRTLAVLQSLTNQVTVTLYYDRHDDFYPTIQTLLNEYQDVNHKMVVRTVDYLRDPGAAEAIKRQYHLAADKNLVIFDAAGRTQPQIISGDQLVNYSLEHTPGSTNQFDMTRKPVTFNGEIRFTTDLLALESPQPLKACYLTGDGEASLGDTNDTRGYLTFGRLIQQNYMTVTELQLLGDQVVPDDCSVLIIAGPTQALAPVELQRIDQYLSQGGRLFLLLDIGSVTHPTGLEPILQRWGINVLPDYVRDLENAIAANGDDLKVLRFGDHPVVQPLVNEQLPMHMIYPRPVAKRDWQNNPPPNAPEVTELAFSGPNSTLAIDTGAAPQSYPLIAAAEQKTASGVASPRGGTRLVVAGDSYFLGNYYLKEPGNAEFVNSAINWLVDRSALVAGVAPQNIIEYHLAMTHAQQRQVRWILLGALPGAVLLLGGLVWLARRK